MSVLEQLAVKDGDTVAVKYAGQVVVCRWLPVGDKVRLEVAEQFTRFIEVPISEVKVLSVWSCA